MSEIARLRAFVLWFINEPKQELGALVSLELRSSPATSSTLRLGVERRRHLCAGEVETPILCGEAP